MRSMCGADAGCLAIDYQFLWLVPRQELEFAIMRQTEKDMLEVFFFFFMTFESRVE